jgi:tetratricopeptide (TPR) repeat protein
MERILIRHLSGARAGEVDEFPASVNEILIGRDPDASVCFDPSREDLVSRQHVKIVRDPESPNEFAIVDLQSRNGTFLNRQRIYAPARLVHGDVIQLGPAGPEFRFEIDPPAAAVTRVPELTGSSLMLAPVREDLAPRPIGRATVERMLGDTFTKVKHESDKAVWVGAAALTAILVVGGIIYIYQRQNAVDAALQAQQNQQLMQQMGQDVKKTPALAEAMREEVVRLNDQLKLSDQRNEERLRRLSQQLAEQEAVTKQAVRDLANRQPAESLPVPPVDIPSSTPVTAAPGDPNQKLDYDAAVRQGVGLLQNGNPDGALKVAQQLMQSQPNRWEAYSIAGSVAKVENKPSQARTMFEKALSLAPDEIKPSLQQALQEISRGGQ